VEFWVGKLYAGAGANRRVTLTKWHSPSLAAAAVASVSVQMRLCVLKVRTR
jgi:hypothetical protein